MQYNLSIFLLGNSKLITQNGGNAQCPVETFVWPHKLHVWPTVSDPNHLYDGPYHRHEQSLPSVMIL